MPSRRVIDHPRQPISTRSAAVRTPPGISTGALALIGLWLVLILFGTPVRAQTPETIRLVGFKYPPFYQEQGNAVEGIAVDMAQALFSRLDLKTEMEIYPLKRALGLLEQGRADGTMILIKTPERSEYLKFTEPTMVVRGLIWSAADREGGPVNFDSLEDLRPYRIGMTRGYSYGHEFDEFLKTMDVEVANTDYQNYLMLLARRTDIFPGNELVAEGLFRMHPELRGKFVHSENAFIEWPLCIALSRKSPFIDLLPRINAEVQRMKNEGVIDEIVRRHTR